MVRLKSPSYLRPSMEKQRSRSQLNCRNFIQSKLIYAQRELLSSTGYYNKEFPKVGASLKRFMMA
ncbi:MAG: hypothetical protein SW833_16065 [Cyanobacteriota bacterium]|nr:hypothetical protein [Cyanobacteriota bacterium]